METQTSATREVHHDSVLLFTGKTMFWISGIAATLIAAAIWGVLRHILMMPIMLLYGARVFRWPQVGALVNVVAATSAVHLAMWLATTYISSTSIYFLLITALMVFVTQCNQTINNENAAWLRDDLVVDDSASDERNAVLRVQAVQRFGRWQIAGSLIGFGVSIAMYASVGG